MSVLTRHRGGRGEDRRQHRRPRRDHLAALLAVVMIATAAAAQDDAISAAGPAAGTASPMRFDELVDALDAESYAAREAAARALMILECPERWFTDCLERTTLSLEQRHRLVNIAQDRLTERPRGAMGISTDSLRARPRDDGAPVEIRVIDLVPGLPAAAVMEVGDRITHVDGQELTNFDQLRDHVQGKHPGDTVRLSILRTRHDARGQVVVDEDGRAVDDELEIDLPLGSADALSRNPGQSESQLLRDRRTQAAAIGRRYRPGPVSIRFEN